MINGFAAAARDYNQKMSRLGLAILGAALWAGAASAGEQQYEELSDSTRSILHELVSDYPPARLYFPDKKSAGRWFAEMSARLARAAADDSILQNDVLRRDFLLAVHYEARRAGLDPQLLLAIAHVESAFRKYAISSAGARGYMQVMPFWVDLIGREDHNLFLLRINLRYGATILRHYLDRENGDYFRALARYNGSLGSARYPNQVLQKWRYWAWP